MPGVGWMGCLKAGRGETGKDVRRADAPGNVPSVPRFLVPGFLVPGFLGSLGSPGFPCPWVPLGCRPGGIGELSSSCHRRSTSSKNLVHRVEPKFPKVAYKSARTGEATFTPPGTAILFVLIHEDGTPEITNGRADPPILLEPAKAAVKQWRFKPFVIDGTKTSVSTVLFLRATNSNSNKERQSTPR
jgi:hypothetical protein